MKIDEHLVAEPNPLPDWRIPYLDYLICEMLAAVKMEAQWLMRCAKSFVIIEGELYRKSHSKVLQHCIPTEQGQRLLRDIHDGICGHHVAPRNLVKNMFRQGLY
jgi:hypothetical protein